MTASDDSGTGQGSRITWGRVLGIVLLTVLLSVGLSVWLISAYVFPTAFTPTVLDASENRVLEAKLDGVEFRGADLRGAQYDASTRWPSGFKMGALKP